MAHFTVVVMYPSRLQETGLDTYCAHVEAGDAYRARRAGARQAQFRQAPGDRGRLKEYGVLVVFRGHLDVQAWGWQP